jgi:hypothetical protein
MPLTDTEHFPSPKCSWKKSEHQEDKRKNEMLTSSPYKNNLKKQNDVEKSQQQKE